MKIKSLIIALAAIFTLGVTASAQTPNSNPTDCKNKKVCHGDRKECKDRKAPNPFEGLSLTQEQQEKLAAIPCPRQVMKAACENKADADSMKANPALRKEMARNVRANYLKQVKAVLTPDQYVQFLENYYTTNPAVKAKKDKNGKDGRHGMVKNQKDKKMKKDSNRKDRRHGNRPQKS